MENQGSIETIIQEIDWLESEINWTLMNYLEQEITPEIEEMRLLMPNLEEADDPYANFIRVNEIDSYGRLALVLAMTPHIKPEALDIFFGKNSNYNRGFTEFGGVIEKDHSGFIPTGQTMMFIASANDYQLRSKILETLDGSYFLMKEQILELGNTEDHLPSLNGVLSISRRWLQYFLTGQMPKIEQSASFPAKQITTYLNWEDIVLNDTVMDQVLEINAWLKHGKTLMDDWELYKKIKPGYRALFYGPPGTGKTLTVTLLGKASGREVYRVDLSMIVSKYIGETEKNLAKIFDIAEHKDWILFFDEADALFGKRTEANSSNDRHANQQTSFLLQRIEDFPGVIILASNLKSNMDEAFTRRFQSMIHFTKPTAEERYQIWKNAFSGTCQLDPDVDLREVANSYEITGGAIINVLRYCALAAIERDSSTVTRYELMQAIRREFKKEGKTVDVYY